MAGSARGEVAGGAARPGRSRLTALLLLAAGASVAGLQPRPEPLGAPVQAADPRYGHHLLLRAGASRDLSDLGTHLETIHLTDPEAVTVVGETLTATAGGISCLRFRYRDGGGANEVQTVCALVFDQTGKCGTRAATSLDLEQFLNARSPRPGQPIGSAGPRSPGLQRLLAGEADYLAQGERTYYGTCRKGGRYRLQRSRKKLPPLMIRVIDAYTDAAGAGDEELDWMRGSPLTTFGGETLSPPWMLPALGPFSDLSLKRDGTVQFDRTPCDEAPECTDKADLARPGDIVLVGHDLPGSAEIEALADSAAAADFVAAHGVTGWEATAALVASDDVRRRTLSRLVGVALMRDFVERFDGMYGLLDAGIPIAWAGNANARTSLSDTCHPDQRASCEQIEAEIGAAEAALVAEWQDLGFEVWWHGWVALNADGSVRSLLEQPPAYDVFDRLVLEINLGGSAVLEDGVDPIQAMERAMAAVAKEVGRKRNVIVSPWAGPMSFYYEGGFCEFVICDSDFTRYYALNEAIFAATLKKFRRKQISALAVPLFEGSHFDILDPHEAEFGSLLNRTGETLANNPLLNIWLSR